MSFGQLLHVREKIMAYSGSQSRATLRIHFGPQLLGFFAYRGRVRLQTAISTSHFDPI